MPINTRSKRREPVNAPAEYAINEATEKTIKINIPISIKSDVQQPVFIKSSLLDISVIGCALDSQYLIPPGVVLDIKVDPAPFAIEEAKDRKDPVLITGSVTSCRMMSHGRYRLGVKFIKIGKEDERLIEYFINIKERRKAPRWDMRA